VINSSLGYSLFDMDVHTYTTDDMDGNTTWITRGADLAAKKGILVVSSAGNSGNEKWTIITAPADGDSVLAVGAVDSTGTYASFSSRGPSADGRVKPNVMAQGSLAYVQRSDGKITKGSGTSFAAPIMAGMATCLWQRFPEKTNYEIIQILEQSSSKYPYPTSKYGYGIPNLGVANDLITSQQLPKTNPGVEFFPNPVMDKIYLTIPEEEGRIIEVRIFDATGQLRQVIPGSAMNRDSQKVLYLEKEITSGIYIAQITTEMNVMTLRFIK
jgi:subtilisin family serine protease